MTDTTQPRHSNAGFFSSASRLVLVRGPAVDVTGVRGYPIDMRVKAQSPQWPLQGMSSPADEYVAVAQFGLGCYERYLAGEGEVWLAAAKQVGEFLLDSQKSDGSWLNLAPFLHTYPLRPPWACGMAHGQAASLLVRLHLETGDDRYAQAARKGLEPLVRPTAQGGVCANLDGAPWPEEYPTEPASFVLNGAIFAWWGMRDVGVGLGDDDASRWFRDGSRRLGGQPTPVRHWLVVAVLAVPTPGRADRELVLPRSAHLPARGDARIVATPGASGDGPALGDVLRVSVAAPAGAGAQGAIPPGRAS